MTTGQIQLAEEDHEIRLEACDEIVFRQQNNTELI